MTVTVKILGLAEFEAKLKTVAPAVAKAAVAAALYAEGTSIMAEAIPLAPIEFGALRGSGHVQAPVVTATGVSVTLGFGGAAKDYALVQHEHLEFNHPRGGQAKYLEQPALEHAETAGPRIGAEIEQALGAAL